jgi:DNA-binding MarR family transcriptional regulator
MSSISRHMRTSKDTMSEQYLTLKLDLIKTEMINKANTAYRKACDLDVRLLRVLRLICDKPRITATALTGQTLVEKSLLSKLLAELIERKLIHRTIHPGDARHFQLWPAAAGKRTRAKTDGLGLILETEMLSTLSVMERTELNRIAEKLVDAFRRSATGGRRETLGPRGRIGAMPSSVLVRQNEAVPDVGHDTRPMRGRQAFQPG